MQEKDPKKKLDELYWGILEDIHIAGESLYMEETILRHASAINEKNFGNLFGTLEKILLDNTRLYIRRIFEKQKRFSLRSIPAILDYLSANKDYLKITDRTRLENRLIQLEADSERLKDLTDNNMDDSELIDFSVSFFWSELENLDKDGPLEKIKDVTDKKIAHNEDVKVEDLNKHTYEEMDKLLDFAKDFVSVVAGGFLNATPIHDNKRCGKGLKRLLVKADVIKIPTKEQQAVVSGAVKKASAQWQSAFNSGDAAGCAAQYETTAVMHARPFGTFTGTSEIQGFWQKLVDDGFTDVEYINPKIEVIDSKNAVLTSGWKMNKASGVIHKELWVLQDDGSAKLREDDFEAQG